MKLTIGKQISATCIMIIAIFMIMDVYMYYLTHGYVHTLSNTWMCTYII